jgi:hypothetical protein
MAVVAARSGYGDRSTANSFRQSAKNTRWEEAEELRRQLSEGLLPASRPAAETDLTDDRPVQRRVGSNSERPQKPRLTIEAVVEAYLAIGGEAIATCSSWLISERRTARSSAATRTCSATPFGQLQGSAKAIEATTFQGLFFRITEI